MDSIAKSLIKSNKTITVEDLIRMYESDGITPDFLMEVGTIDSVPSAFYTKLSELHNSQKTVQEFKAFESVDKYNQQNSCIMKMNQYANLMRGSSKL